MAEIKLGDPTLIWVGLTPNEAEILAGAIAQVSPADKAHEMILFMLFNRIQNKLQEFLQR